MAKKPDFEKSISRLEEIVQQLADGSLPLAESVKLYEEGMKLCVECHDILDKAEQKIINISELEAKSKEDDSNE